LEYTEVRFTVDLPSGDAFPWRTWAMGYGVSEDACDMAAAGSPARWYVCERPILRPEWAQVIWSGNRRPFAALD